MNDMKSTIESLAAEFAVRLIATIKKASLADLACGDGERSP